MKVTLTNSAIILSSLILAACGSDSDDHSDAHEEHEHALMISQQNTTALSFLEEGAAENLDDAAAANGAALLLSNTGEHAAIITAGQVQFVVAHLEEEEEGEAHDEEEHELPELSTLELSSSTAQPIVANTIGHFSVLVDGVTQLVPYSSLEEGATPEAEELGLDIADSEEYPALLLEEGDEVVALGFDGINAKIYEDGAASDVVEHSTACETVNSSVHSGEFALVSCDNASFSVKLEEGVSDHTIEITTIAGVSTPVTWATRGGVFVGLGNDDKFYVLEENADEELELEGSAFDVPASMCGWGIDSLEADIFALTATQITIFDHEGESHSITLDETENADCDDLRMTTSNSAVFVFDNLNGVLYEIDKEVDATEYHIHGREDLSVDDVADAVNFHEVGTESHDHEH